MTPTLWTLTDWAVLCAALALVGTLGQLLWNVMLADVFDWEDAEPGEQIPPLFWAAAAIVLFIAVAVFFYAGHWAGF